MVDGHVLEDLLEYSRFVPLSNNDVFHKELNLQTSVNAFSFYDEKEQETSRKMLFI